MYKVPKAYNEPVLNYEPDSPETLEVKAELRKMMSEVKDIPMVIGGREVRTKKKN